VVLDGVLQRAEVAAGGDDGPGQHRDEACGEDPERAPRATGGVSGAAHAWWGSVRRADSGCIMSVSHCGRIAIWDSTPSIPATQIHTVLLSAYSPDSRRFHGNH